MCHLIWLVIRTNLSCCCVGRTRLKVLAAMSACSTTMGGVQIVRWNGPFGNFSVLSGSGPHNLGRRLVSGDVIKATVIGNTITAYINGVH